MTAHAIGYTATSPNGPDVVEATTNAWDFYDVTSPFVQRVVVANAAKIALIAKTRTKTDNKDVMVLARLSAAGLIPEVRVPPMDVRELRSLIAHRRRVVGTRTSLKNRLQSVLHRHHLVLPSGDPFSDIHRAWWDTLPVSPTERLHLKHDLATVAQLDTQVAEIEDELRRLSCVALEDGRPPDSRRARRHQASHRASRRSTRTQAGTGSRQLSRANPQPHIARSPRRKKNGRRPVVGVLLKPRRQLATDGHSG